MTDERRGGDPDINGLDQQFQQELEKIVHSDPMETMVISPFEQMVALVGRFDLLGWPGPKNSSGQTIMPKELIRFMQSARENIIGRIENTGGDITPDLRQDVIDKIIDDTTKEHRITSTLGIRAAVNMAIGTDVMILLANKRIGRPVDESKGTRIIEIATDEDAERSFAARLKWLKREARTIVGGEGFPEDWEAGIVKDMITRLSDKRWAGIKNSAGQTISPEMMIQQIDQLLEIANNLPVELFYTDQLQPTLNEEARKLGITRSMQFRELCVAVAVDAQIGRLVRHRLEKM